MKVKRTYRLEEDTLRKLEEVSKSEHVTATEALERCVRAYGLQHDGAARGQDGLSEVAYDLLAGQLAVKDGQIASLSRALEAAQTLHAIDGSRRVMEDGTVRDSGSDGRRNLLRRLADAWRGR